MAIIRLVEGDAAPAEKKDTIQATDLNKE